MRTIQSRFFVARNEDAKLAATPLRLLAEDVGEEEGETAIVEQPPHVDRSFRLLPLEVVHKLHHLPVLRAHCNKFKHWLVTS